MKLEIEVPEPAADREYTGKIIKRGAYSDGSVISELENVYSLETRPCWVPPSWLPEGTWLYWDNGKWFASHMEPNEKYPGYGCPTNQCVDIERVADALRLDFTPPEGTRKLQIHHTSNSTRGE